MKLILSSEAETHLLAEFIASNVRAGDVITLTGTLGTGKTSFARRFIEASTKDVTDIQSPTFPILITYPHSRLNCEIYHMDCYRLKSLEEAYQLGIEDAFGQHLFLIEWPEIIRPILPSETLDITIAYGSKETERVFEIHGSKYWIDKLASYTHGT